MSGTAGIMSRTISNDIGFHMDGTGGVERLVLLKTGTKDLKNRLGDPNGLLGIKRRTHCMSSPASSFLQIRVTAVAIAWWLKVDLGLNKRDT